MNPKSIVFIAASMLASLASAEDLKPGQYQGAVRFSADKTLDIKLEIVSVEGDAVKAIETFEGDRHFTCLGRYEVAGQFDGKVLTLPPHPGSDSPQCGGMTPEYADGTLSGTYWKKPYVLKLKQ